MSTAALIGALRVTLGIDTAQWEEGVKNTQKDLKRLTKSYEQMGGKMKSIGSKMSLAITAPLVAFGYKSFQAASDATELSSAFGETFGSMTDDMNDWAIATGDSMGRSTQEMQKGANAFGIFFNQAAKTRGEAAKMSKDFTVLAQDLSSFFNVEPDVAMEKLRSGLMGQSEPLRDFGVFLTEAAVNAKGLEMGLEAVDGKLTEQAKVMARAAIIMETTKNAQGDVGRTSHQTANQIRAAKAAWEELLVIVGTKLIPVITPVITKFGELLNKFTNLDPAIQSAVIGFAAVAAVVGPLVYGLGALVQLAAPLLATMKLVSTFAATTAAASGLTGFAATMVVVKASLAALMTVLVPVLVPLAAIAALAAVIYVNWDKIAPVLKRFQAALSEVIGPDLKKLIDTATKAFTEFWEGPLGDGLRKVVSLLGDLVVAFLEVFGAGFILLIKGAVTVIQIITDQIGNLVSLASNLLKGDWAAAWQSAKDVVNTAFGGLPAYVADIFSKMVSAIKEWVIRKLGAVWDELKAKIDSAKKMFFDLYDAVVGNSYIPDMVDEIGQHMRRLEKELVEPVKKATSKAKQEFRALQEDILALMTRIFPDRARKNTYLDEVAKIEEAMKKGIIKGKEYEAMLAALRSEYFDELFGPNDPKKEFAKPIPDDDPMKSGDWVKILKDAEKVTEKFAKSAQEKTAAVIQSFAEMARDAVSSVRGMVNSFKSGDILGGILGFLDLIAQVAGIVGSFKGGPAPKTATPTFNRGGMPGFKTGGSFTVGGSGGADSKLVQFMATPGEMVNVSKGEKSSPSSGSQNFWDLRGAVVTQDLLDEMRSLAQGAKAEGALMGSSLAQEQLIKRQERTLP